MNIPKRWETFWEVPALDVNSYLETVSAQIRCKKARKFVLEELRLHIEEQAAAYRNEGINEEEASRLAILDMGDPLETGMQMDRIHRPKVEWKFLVIVGILSLLGIFIQFVIGQYKGEAGLYANQTGLKQLLYVIIGIAIMMIVYFVDYTIIGKYPKILWFGYFAVCVLVIKLGTRVNGISPMGYPLGCVFIPLYAGILFSMRGRKWKGIVLASLYIFMPVYVAGISGTMTGMLQTVLICIIMLCTCAFNNWFGLDKKKAFGIISGEIMILLFHVVRIMISSQNGYRMTRLKAYLNPIQYENSLGYVKITIRNAILECKLFGKSSKLSNLFLSMSTDYVFFLFFSCLGIVAGLGVVCVIAIFIRKLWMISFKQTSSLGFMIAFSISLLMTIQVAIYIISNLGYGILSQMNLPLLSYGRFNIVNFAIIGLILSVYRNTNIIDNKKFNINVNISDDKLKQGANS